MLTVHVEPPRLLPDSQDTWAVERSLQRGQSNDNHNHLIAYPMQPAVVQNTLGISPLQ